MDEQVELQCPYCFEWIDVYISPDTSGSLVEDCEVCCHPWQLEVRRDEEGSLQVSVSRAQ